jgi:hypothetical protein
VLTITDGPNIEEATNLSECSEIPTTNAINNLSCFVLSEEGRFLGLGPITESVKKYFYPLSTALYSKF